MVNIVSSTDSHVAILYKDDYKVIQCKIYN